jgi:hypothetical protein
MTDDTMLPKAKANPVKEKKIPLCLFRTCIKSLLCFFAIREALAVMYKF